MTPRKVSAVAFCESAEELSSPLYILVQWADGVLTLETEGKTVARGIKAIALALALDDLEIRKVPAFYRTFRHTDPDKETCRALEWIEAHEPERYYTDAGQWAQDIPAEH